MRRLALPAVACLAANLAGGLAATSAAAQASERRIRDICRGYAATQLYVATSLIATQYEAAPGGGHVVTGTTQASPATEFRCEFDASGRRIVRFTHSTRKD